jgi:hypothetical protein
VNVVSDTIEKQLNKQHITELFKNRIEAEAEELDIDSAAKEVAEILKNVRSKIVPASFYTSGKGDRTENLDGDGDNSEEDDIQNDDDDDDDCDTDDDELDYDTKHSIAQIGKTNSSSNDGNNNRIIHVQKKRPFQSSEAKSNDEVVPCNQMAFIRNQMTLINAAKVKRRYQLQKRSAAMKC